VWAFLAAATENLPGDHGWRTSLGLAMIPAIALTAGGIWLPETPNSLCERGHTERARRILCSIRGTQEVDAEFEDIQEAARIACEVPIKSFADPFPHPSVLVPGHLISDGVCPCCIQT